MTSILILINIQKIKDIWVSIWLFLLNILFVFFLNYENYKIKCVPWYKNKQKKNIQKHKGSIMRSGWNQYRPQSGQFNNMEKRHIGSLARLGMLRSDIDRSYNQKPVASMFRQEQTEKRHIGALARSGWLPAFRPVRGGRFSRSGRARSRTVGS